MNITLFGGAFDPPHIGHLHVAQTLLTNHITEEVWFVPVKRHPFSKELQASDQQRIEMLQLMIGEGMRIDTFELSSPEVSYAFYTLEGLSQQHPAHTFSWVIGSDNLKSFHKWGFYEQLLEKYTVYVYPRAGHPFEPLYDNMIPLTTMSEVEASSTKARELIKQQLPLDGVVTAEVAAYIADQQLYR